jgi:hypothetical protein
MSVYLCSLIFISAKLPNVNTLRMARRWHESSSKHWHRHGSAFCLSSFQTPFSIYFPSLFFYSVLFTEKAVASPSGAEKTFDTYSFVIARPLFSEIVPQVIIERGTSRSGLRLFLPRTDRLSLLVYRTFYVTFVHLWIYIFG